MLDQDDLNFMYTLLKIVLLFIKEDSELAFKIPDKLNLKTDLQNIRLEKS